MSSKEKILIAIVIMLLLTTVFLSFMVLNIQDKLKGIEENSKPVDLTKIEQRLDYIDSKVFEQEQGINSLGNDFKRIEKILFSLGEIELKYGQVIGVSNQNGKLSLEVKWDSVSIDKEQKETIKIPSDCELYAAGQYGLVKVELNDLPKIVASSSERNFLKFIFVKGKLVQIYQ